jgi:hypothetical protein
VVADALDLARDWCAEHIIDSAPALGHAVKVALVLGQHVPNAVPELVAAALLHNCPEYAPKDIDLDATLTAWFGIRVTHVVRGLEREHIALDQRPVPDVIIQDRWTLYVSATDKIVRLRSVLRRAARAPDPAAYWHARQALIARLPTSPPSIRPPPHIYLPAWPGNSPGSWSTSNRPPHDSMLVRTVRVSGNGRPDDPPPLPWIDPREPTRHMTRSQVGQYHTGQMIKVEATSIQRSNGGGVARRRGTDHRGDR